MADPKSDEPDEIAEFWKRELDRQNEEYAEQQRVLESRQQAQLLAQQQAALQAQREFEEQQRRLAEQQQREREALLAQQAQWQTQGRLAELERENLNARAQYERDQLMLQQYDQRVRALEAELQAMQNNFSQQNASKDDQIRALQEQVNTWRTKYEALAKLYSQLRQEHLDLLHKFKTVQLKASSAQEAIDRREKLEREIKTKNLELADMIRERDRLLNEKGRQQASQRDMQDEVERLKRELRLKEERLEKARDLGASETAALVDRHARQVLSLQDEAAAERAKAAETLTKLRAVEDELEVYKASMDQLLLEMEKLKVDGAGGGGGGGGGRGNVNDIIDSVLQAGVARVDDALYELDSTMEAGNQNASPAYVLSQIEKASGSATEFTTAFNDHIANETAGTAEPVHVVKAVSVFSGALADVCRNTKGLLRLATDESRGDQLINGARQPAQATIKFLRGLLSVRLEGMDAIQRTDVVINGNLEVQMALQRLSKLVEGFAPGFGKLSSRAGDLGDLVDQELARAADAIAAAAERLAKLKNKPRDGYTTQELRVHDVIVDAAAAITAAVAQLVKAATVSQAEIVAAGRGSSSRAAFYKKNNRWTEGLVSAAKAVAASTTTLIETADGVIANRNSPEQLIVASNDVAASTAQLVAASRVKAAFMSRSQEALEAASKAVGQACRALVRQVQELIKDRGEAEEKIDYSKLGAHEFKVREMEQQVRIPVLVSITRNYLLRSAAPDTLLTVLCAIGRDPAAGECSGRSEKAPGRDAQDFVPGIARCVFALRLASALILQCLYWA